MPGCSAPGCTNRSEKGMLMKSFPRDVHRRSLWVSQMKRIGWQATDNSFLCEAHFDDDQWEKVRDDGSLKLKVFAVPTLFPDNIRKPCSTVKRMRPPSPDEIDRAIDKLNLIIGSNDEHTKVEQLQQKLKETDSKMASLIKELNHLKREIKQLTTELIERKAETELMTRELVDKNAEAEQFQTQLKGCYAETTELKRKLGDTNTEMEDLRRDFFERIGVTEHLLWELNHMESVTQELKRELIGKNEEIERLQNKLVEVNAHRVDPVEVMDQTNNRMEGVEMIQDE